MSNTTIKEVPVIITNDSDDGDGYRIKPGVNGGDLAIHDAKGKRICSIWIDHLETAISEIQDYE